MQKEQCISLCEIMEYINQIEPRVERAIERICGAAGYNRCERIYVGSSFCGQYFLHLSEKLLDEVMAYSKEKGIKVTLVVPIFTQKYLEKGKKKISELIELYDNQIDEITVNDYGMLLAIHKAYRSKRLNMGRLFMKDYREPRYEAYFNGMLKPKVFTNFLKKLIKQYEISGMEFDPTHRTIDFSEKPEDIQISIYAPYSYITVGQICEIGSISKGIDKKFRPNEPCGAECYTHRMRYYIEGSADWRRIGRAVYFENREPEIKGINQVREIYAPLDWEEDNESISAFK